MTLLETGDQTIFAISCLRAGNSWLETEPLSATRNTLIAERKRKRWNHFTSQTTCDWWIWRWKWNPRWWRGWNRVWGEWLIVEWYSSRIYHDLRTVRLSITAKYGRWWMSSTHIPRWKCCEIKERCPKVLFPLEVDCRVVMKPRENESLRSLGNKEHLNSCRKEVNYLLYFTLQYLIQTMAFVKDTLD